VYVFSVFVVCSLRLLSVCVCVQFVCPLSLLCACVFIVFVECLLMCSVCLVWQPGSFCTSEWARQRDVGTGSQ
jgi:hypothetical protein